MSLKMALGISVLLTLGLVTTPALAQRNISLSVDVENFKSSEGQFCYSLYNSSRGFPNSPSSAVLSECISLDSLDNGNLTFTIEDLEGGTYALAVFHDENRNEKLDTGAFGAPTEDFGFSNNPSIGFGAPEFGKCAVVVFGKTKTKIKLKSLF